MEALAIKRQGRRISPRQIVIQQLRLRLNFEKRLRRQLEKLFRDIGREASRSFEDSQRVLITEREIGQRLTDMFGPFLRSVIEEFGSQLLEQQKALPMFDKVVARYMRDHAAVHIRNISVTTMRQMRSTLAQAERETLGIANTSKLIRERFGGQFARSRAATIARTETHGAMTFAQMETAREQLDQDGLMKQWVSVGDPRTRSHHKAVNGQKVGIEEKFVVPVGGIEYLMDRPADPNGGPANVINCRCAVIFVYPEDDVAKEEPQASAEPWLYREKIKPTGNLRDWHAMTGVSYRTMDAYSSSKVQRAKEFGLTDDEIRGVMEYTGSGYMKINPMLRDWFYSKRTLAFEDKEALIGINQTIASGLSKMPPYVGRTARGISVDDVDEFMQINEIKKGSIYRAESVFSTKTGDRPDDYFAGNVTYRIEGKNGRYVDEISINSGEAEVLFPAGHEFEITDVQVTDGFRKSVTIFMKDIGEGLKSDESYIREIITKSVRRGMQKRMQSEAPLASVNGVLLNGV